VRGAPPVLFGAIGKGHVEHVTATISSCQPELATRLQETDVRPQRPSPQTKGDNTRETESLGRAGGRADAVPFGRAALAFHWMDADADAVAVAWTPSKMRAEAAAAAWAWPAACLAGKATSEAAARRVESLEPRHRSAPGPRLPPVGRWDLAARWFVRPRPRRPGSKWPASDLSVLDLDRLARSGSQSQGPPVHGVESCGCGRAC
jgi:hypothetical protein